MIRYLLLTFTVIVLVLETRAQAESWSLSPDQVIDRVLRFHPAAKRARLEIEKSKAELTRARGWFDPYFSTKVGAKTFDGSRYYEYTRPQLSVPTWLGVELTAGLENLAGDRANPEDSKGKNNFLGLSVPLAKNLLMDKRRAALQQAKITTQLRETELRSLVNNLLNEALQAYWNWVQRYRVSEILKQVVEANERRLQFVKTSFVLGDRPAIDTAEALTQLQSFQLALNEAELQRMNTALGLSVYLWSDEDQPFDLPENTRPALQDQNALDADLPDPDGVIKNHPDLQQYDQKLAGLRVDQKLKFQSLLPEVNVEYNWLGKGYRLLKTPAAPLLENNYRYGLSIGIPLRFSEGRGEYRAARLKLAQARLERDQKQREISNKMSIFRNTLATLNGQLGLQRQQLASFQALQRAEELRYQSGESSLFLVNSRETRTLEARQKLVEMETRFAQGKIAMRWIAGQLPGDLSSPD